jgi:DNA-directed RNA polymerase
MSDQQLNAGKQLDCTGYTAQVELESWSKSTGAGRVLSGRWESGAAGALGNHLARLYLEQVLETYRRSKHQPGRQALIWELMHDEKAVVQVALESLFYVLGNVHDEQPYNKVCNQIGKRAEHALWLTHPVWKNSLHLKGLRLASNGDMNMDLIVKRLKDKGFKKAALYKPLSHVEKIALGAFFVECIARCTHLMEIYMARQKRKTVKMIRLTEVYWGFLGRWKEHVLMFRPLHMPMTMPPRPYTNAVDGGYQTITTAISTVDPLLFGRQFRKAKPGVIGALNTLQSQAYSLDHAQIDLQRSCWELGHEVGNLPRRDRLPKPIDREYKVQGLGPEAFWKAHWAWKADQRKDTERSRFVNALVAYQRVKTFDQLYLVHHFDHRGRVYSRGAQLNIQGGDVYRSTFRFAAKGPMKGHEDGFAWSLGEAMALPPNQEVRSRFLMEHTAAVRAAGQDPLDHLGFWSQQKEPWRFLQLCRDWAQYLDDPGFTTGTIHWLDQTSSGYGHAACLLLDKQLAKFTNVIGSQAADLYHGAGLVTEARLKALAREEEDPKRRQILEWWLAHKPGRKLWKKVFMPLVYGQTYQGVLDVITLYLREALSNFLTEDGLRIFDLANVLATETHAVSKEVMPGVLSLQKWLIEVGRLQLKANHKPHWYTPDGLLVEVYRHDMALDQIKLVLANRTVRIVTKTNEGAPIDKKRSTSGIAAHFVHSQDGAFLRRFVNHWQGYGHPISTVHDCFGTTVDRVTTMRKELNDQWARFYSVDYLTHLQGYTAALVGEPVPAPPIVGDLDRNGIGGNPFLFG